MESKYDHEYLLKYKGASYLHVDWVAATDIEAMNTRSKQVYIMCVLYFVCSGCNEYIVWGIVYI